MKMKQTPQIAHAEALAKLDIQLAVITKVSADAHKLMETESANWGNVADLNRITEWLNNIVEMVGGQAL